MITETGQLDKLVEKRVDDKINQFAQSIADQMERFINQNSTLHTSIYEITNWKNGEPTAYSAISKNQFKSRIYHGMVVSSLKHSMIIKETKELLYKINLLNLE